MKTGAVVVATGKSGKLTPMVQIGTISVAKRIVSTLQQAGCEPVVVVTGYQAEVIEKNLSRCGVVFLHEDDFETSQLFDSAKIGLAYIKDKCDSVLFTPADVPLFTAQTISKMLACDKDIVVPVFDGKQGHPLLLKCEVIPEIFAHDCGGGLMQAIYASNIEIHRVEVEDKGILCKTDMPEEYETLVLSHNSQLFRPVLSLRLARENIFFGPDAARLLCLIQDTGSVKLACQRMNLSYSKGWTILKKISAGVGAPVTEGKQGGPNGGYTELTEKGLWLVERFRAYESDCRSYAEKSFYKYFSED